jgi:hypothetical protein
MNRIYCSPFTRIMVIVGFGLLLSTAGLPSAARQAEKEEGSKRTKSRLDGAWRLVSAKDADGQAREAPAGVEMTKLVVDGRFAWTVAQNGTAVSGAGGTYTVTDDAYTEKVTYGVTDNQQPLVGKTFTFTWKLEGGKWHHKGVLKTDAGEQIIDEVWERIP